MQIRKLTDEFTCKGQSKRGIREIYTKILTNAEICSTIVSVR